MTESVVTKVMPQRHPAKIPEQYTIDVMAVLARRGSIVSESIAQDTLLPRLEIVNILGGRRCNPERAIRACPEIYQLNDALSAVHRLGSLTWNQASQQNKCRLADCQIRNPDNSFFVLSVFVRIPSCRNGEQDGFEGGASSAHSHAASRQRPGCYYYPSLLGLCLFHFSGRGLPVPGRWKRASQSKWPRSRRHRARPGHDRLGARKDTSATPGDR